MKCRHKLFRVESKAFPYVVPGDFGDIEMFTECRERRELSGEPCIKEGYEEAERVRETGDDNGNEQGVGRDAGGARGAHGKTEPIHKRTDSMFIKVFYFMVRAADIEEKPYHGIVFSGKGRALLFINLLVSVSFSYGIYAVRYGLRLLFYYADKSRKYQEVWE